MNHNTLERAVRVMERGTQPHYVYFIRGEGKQPVVKIGTTTRIDGRLMDLRHDNTQRPDDLDPSSLRFLGWVEGDHELETLLKRSFADERIKGEWFDYLAIRDRINDLLARACVCRGCQMEGRSLAHF